MWDGYLSSNYHSLQVAVNRSFSKGLMVKAAYTYSKAIDYTDDDGWAAVGWNWAPVFQRNRATAGFDRTHVLQIGWLYELPFGKGKTLAKSGVAAAILGGWQVNGVMAAYTGTPFTVTAPGTSLNAPNNTQTANQVKTTVSASAPSAPGHLLRSDGLRVGHRRPSDPADATSFAIPGVWNTDLNITREFHIKERLKLQFRAEFFNFPNTSHFGGVSSTSVTSGTFMQITSASGERQIRFGLRAQW